eukprot:CAMPEP_0168166490 /NCGR_PEP_ID=MMETSP0139_2-20121125/2054_1 /TAXON_ID=44445 /ORGANISM="Pseudo-nitzschia australis, Strain 10249 10 AB" /LENGTH=91 /DNA_ID=CAMNT_0008083689 /DNA_START=61 /DNA_END=336 /DNA_ORIENTATION=+
MYRTLTLFALCIAAASAFAPIAQQAIATPMVGQDAAPQFMENTITEFSNQVASSQMIASSVSDFGGYFFPLFGIISLAGLILFLAPPLADE